MTRIELLKAILVADGAIKLVEQRLEMLSRLPVGTLRIQARADLVGLLLKRDELLSQLSKLQAADLGIPA